MACASYTSDICKLYYITKSYIVDKMLWAWDHRYARVDAGKHRKYVLLERS